MFFNIKSVLSIYIRNKKYYALNLAQWIFVELYMDHEKFSFNSIQVRDQQSE